jgi:uncharacterized protein (DUF3820 family)
VEKVPQIEEHELHKFVMPNGKHQGERLVHVPVGYLKWMVNVNHTCAAYAEAELARRGTVTPDIDVSGHAIDRASLYCLEVWKSTRNENEGLHAWLVRVAQEALEKGEEREGKIHYMGMKMVFVREGKWPVLQTVIRR